VVELGTNHPGEIQRLAEIADPDFGVITSVAAAHLEGLSSIAGVAREKGSLFKNIRAGGAIAVNIDDPRVRRLGAKFRGAKLIYGNRGRLKARSVHLNNASGVGFTLHAGKQRCAVRLNYLGQHNVTNALGAAALTVAAGANLTAVRRGLARARPFAMRMEIEKWRGIGIINDAYNANPASMRAALRTLEEIPARGRKIAVLGDMFELGRHSRHQHRDLGKAAAQAKLDHLYLLGSESGAVRQGALGAGMASERVTIGKDHDDLANQLRSQVRAGDWLLFKGSRGMKMENVLKQLRAEKA
jgi:UDP-N-acetylmuramoyl-tripeptide--D-alanyl-D-alanine ligase